VGKICGWNDVIIWIILAAKIINFWSVNYSWRHVWFETSFASNPTIILMCGAKLFASTLAWNMLQQALPMAWNWWISFHTGLVGQKMDFLCYDSCCGWIEAQFSSFPTVGKLNQGVRTICPMTIWGGPDTLGPWGLRVGHLLSCAAWVPYLVF
jgi:hypothetical protein